MPVLGVAVIAAVIVASVFWFREHEGDGRSDYERVVGQEDAALAASFICFPRSPWEEEVAELNQNPAAEDALVPGETERLLLCRYWGMNHGKQSLKLAKRKLVTKGSDIRQIADGLNDLPDFPDGVFACPSDEGGRTLAIFAYSDDPQLVVELNFEGCSSATNGRGDVASLGDPIARQIENLVPLPPSN
jgi:hypothetical protein